MVSGPSGNSKAGNVIALRQELELQPGRQRIWVALCLTVLVLAVFACARVYGTQEGTSRPLRNPEPSPQAAAFMLDRNGAEPPCENLLSRDSAAWTAGQTAVPALFVAQTGTEASSIWLGQRGHSTGPAGPSYSSIWRELTLPTDAESLTLAWSWRLQTSEAPTAAPSSLSDRQQALLLNDQGELLKVMYSARAQAPRVTEQRYDLSPFAGEVVRVYFNAYNDGDGQPTSLRLDHWTLLACHTATEPTAPIENMNANGASRSDISAWGPAARGFSFWVLAIFAFITLAGIGLVEESRSRSR